MFRSLATATLLFAFSGTLVFSGYGPDAGILQELLLLTMAAAGFVTISGIENPE